MPEKIDILAIGHAITDILTNSSDEFLASLPVPVSKGMMCLVDARTINILCSALPEKVKTVPGGSACNSVVALAEMGAKCAFAGTIANDQYGRAFSAALEQAGIDFPIPPLKDSPGSGASLIMITPDGERTMFSFLGASSCLTAEHIREYVSISANWLLVEGYLLDNPNAPAMIEAAKADKIALSLSDPLCVRRHHEQFKILAKKADLIFANKAEMQVLLASSNEQEMKEGMQKSLPGIVVMTCSDAPAIVCHNRSILEIPAEKIGKIVDSTGAGDHFAAGFLYGLLQNLPLAECAALGHRRAAAIIRQVGARK